MGKGWFRVGCTAIRSIPSPPSGTCNPCAVPNTMTLTASNCGQACVGPCNPMNLPMGARNQCSMCGGASVCGPYYWPTSCRSYGTRCP